MKIPFIVLTRENGIGTLVNVNNINYMVDGPGGVGTTIVFVDGLCSSFVKETMIEILEKMKGLT